MQQQAELAPKFKLKRLVMMRGAPGAGKSHATQTLEFQQRSLDNTFGVCGLQMAHAGSCFQFTLSFF